MNCIEHYFENLLTMGADIKGEPNKNALSKEVQEAIEICAYYIKYNQFQEQTTKNDIRYNRVKNELNQVKNELEPTTKNDLSLIHTEGLDEEIRCTMCTNSIKSDRGCDGNCVVNNAMYKKIMDVIENHIADTDKMIESTTKNDLGVNKTFYEQMVEYCNEHFLVLVEKDVWEDARKALTTKNDLGVDCISRADARSLICKIDQKHHMSGMSWKAFKDLYNGIDELPSVTPQEPRWIPVSEKLPEKTGWYLITFKTYNGDDAVSEMCYRKPENYWTRDNICKKVLDSNEVVAWMPLPKAYREVEE